MYMCVRMYVRTHVSYVFRTPVGQSSVLPTPVGTAVHTSLAIACVHAGRATRAGSGLSAVSHSIDAGRAYPAHIASQYSI